MVVQVPQTYSACPTASSSERQFIADFCSSVRPSGAAWKQYWYNNVDGTDQECCGVSNTAVDYCGADQTPHAPWQGIECNYVLVGTVTTGYVTKLYELITFPHQFIPTPLGRSMLGQTAGGISGVSGTFPSSYTGLTALEHLDLTNFPAQGLDAWFTSGGLTKLTYLYDPEFPQLLTEARALRNSDVSGSQVLGDYQSMTSLKTLYARPSITVVLLKTFKDIGQPPTDQRAALHAL